MKYGRWELGIGDPGFVGWFTVIVYIISALSCAYTAWSASKNTDSETRKRLIIFWSFLTCALIFLGINKQLDLQALLTEIGRKMAKEQGWYELRRKFQTVFILSIGVISLVFFAFLVRWIKGIGRQVGLAMFGILFLITFVVVRASSFHHLDSLLSIRLSVWKLNWILELTGVFFILLGSLLAHKSKEKTGNQEATAAQ